MCECKNLEHHEVRGDYDGILYTKCKDCGKMVNKFTGIEFDQVKQNGYNPLYQYKDGELVGFSKYKAKGLSYNDDISLGENLLWGTRGKKGTDETLFVPIKDLSISHIKSIIVGLHTNRPEYLAAMVDRLTSVINIKN